MERGCVVLDQPQHAMKSQIMLAPSLRLVFDTAALHF
jgi:hypothetical protein